MPPGTVKGCGKLGKIEERRGYFWFFVVVVVLFWGLLFLLDCFGLIFKIIFIWGVPQAIVGQEGEWNGDS